MRQAPLPSCSAQVCGALTCLRCRGGVLLEQPLLATRPLASRRSRCCLTPCPRSRIRTSRGRPLSDRAPWRRAHRGCSLRAAARRQRPWPQSREDHAVGQVDALAGGARGLGDFMAPEALRGSPHQEQAAVGQVQPVLQALRLPVAQNEGPCRPERQRRHLGAGAQLGLVVRMQAHRVAAPSVQVAEAAVPAVPGLRDQALPDGRDLGRPGQRRERSPRVPVRRIQIAVPRGQPRLRDRPPHHRDGLLRPVKTPSQGQEQRVGRPRVQPARRQRQPRAVAEPKQLEGRRQSARRDWAGRGRGGHQGVIVGRRPGWANTP